MRRRARRLASITPAAAYSEATVTLEGWIFMVGLRVFDVGALIVWLVWFYRRRDEDDDAWGSDDGPGPEPEAPEPPGPKPGGLELPLPDAAPWPARRRDHTGDLPPAMAPPRRRSAPERTPQRV